MLRGGGGELPVSAIGHLMYHLYSVTAGKSVLP